MYRIAFSIVVLSVVFSSGCGKKTTTTSNTPTSNSPSGLTVQVHAGQGVMVGEVTATTALVQVRLTRSDRLVDGDVAGIPGIVKFSLRPSDQSIEVQPDASWLQEIKATAENDFIVRAAIEQLAPGAEYTCTTEIGTDETSFSEGPTATWRTLPGKDQPAPVSFVVVTGMNYAKFHGDDRIDRAIHLKHNNTELPAPYDGPDKQLGYPALETILKLKPHFFIGTGDNVYYDTPKEPRAETVQQMRQKWHEQFVQPRYRDLFAAVPTYWEIDDHDYRIDDGDNSGDFAPSPERAQKIMLEQLPYGPMGSEGVTTYRTHRVSPDLQLWFVENRIYRSDNTMSDGPGKSIWGPEQKAWLKESLSSSDATFKILVSPNPMIGPDDSRKTDNHTNMGGFQNERDEFFTWLKESSISKHQFAIVCGDRHWQYHSIHPDGIEEFSCGALVDANSRPGRKPGDPLSTDPNGTIKQVYSQEKPSGGFLNVRLSPSNEETPAMLAFKFYDERGAILYENTKIANLRTGK